MTTLTAIADKAAKFVFYGLMLMAPVCGDGDAALKPVHASIVRHILLALQSCVHAMQL